MSTSKKKRPFQYWYRARIVAVYDGDTVTANIDLGFRVSLRKIKLRLYGIDTPELRGASHAAGIVARDRLRALVLGKRVDIHTYRDRTGKYGRWLAEIWVDGPDGEMINVNDKLVAEGLARPY